MSNLIEAELDYSQKYQLETEKDVKLVKISRENVALVEAMIRYSSYGSAVQNDNPKSAKYWIGLLRDFYSKPTDPDCQKLKKKIKESKPNEMPVDSGIFRFLIEKIVGYIDSENSTHLQADGCGRSEIVDRIVNDVKEKNLYNWLHEENYELIRILSDPTHPISKGKKYNPRCNFSFATKFCHYMCFYLFEGSEKQDNFSIYDGVVAKNLYLYIDPKGKSDEYIFNKDTDDPKTFYEKYQKAIDEIRIRGEKISRNGFDHLLWYFHK